MAARSSRRRGPKAAVSAAIARRIFLKVTDRLGLSVSTDGSPADLVIHRPEEFFGRIGSDGLIGFGESYMTGAWDAEDLGATLSRADVERSPFYELMGIELGGATQSIGAAAATAHDAELLLVPPGSPVLRCERITRSVDDRPVLMSEHVFPAHLTEFVVDLPHVQASIAPSGFRLVD